MLRDRLPTFLRMRRVPTVTVALSAATALLWLAVVGGWLPMPGSGGTGTAMSDPGAPEAMGTGNGLSGVLAYLLMWGVMMAAMMYPSMIPAVRRRVAAVDGPVAARAGDAAVLLGVYSLVWTATGLVPLAVDAVVPLASLAADHRPLALGAAFLLAGGYQLSAPKATSLRDCCGSAPDGSATCESSPGLLGAARAGLDHGRCCVKCTWALFALMVVIGSMNVLWMVVLTAVVALERLVDWGDEIRVATGLLGVVAGLAVLAFGVPPV